MAPAFRSVALAVLWCIAAPGALAQAAAATPPDAPPSGTVTIYRCIDARGKLALRDRPCPGGQAQTTREMQRIVDPPRRARVAPDPVPAAAPPPAPQVIVVNTPRPMYACTTPDGSTYTSDTPEGNPRWVPLWTLGYPVVAGYDAFRPGGISVRHGGGTTDVRAHTPSIERRVVPTLAAYGAGTWVRDACNALPQADTCYRLRDRRDELRRRAFNAQPSERVPLDLEERSINARLAADCGAY